MGVFELLVLCAAFESSLGSGFFEIQIISVENIRGELTNGSCCGSRDSRYANCSCVGECATYLRICLKQYQARISTTGQCTFGNRTTVVFGGNSFKLSTELSALSEKLPFQFSWTRSYTIIVTALHKKQGNAEDLVIEISAHSGIILPGVSWHTLTYNGPTATLVYRIRVLCDEHYFNTTCTKFCQPRNDGLGHYTCNTNGDKVCMEGWLGAECDIAICKTGCHVLHGSCDQPGECKCGFGWQGSLCDRCIPYPGCKHGTCKDSPWTCDCNLNWGGILCDKDLNTCRHKPCQNDGMCVNNVPDNYTCVCSKGFSGRDCQIVDDLCSSNPCTHGGSCLQTVDSFVCNCQQGWTGETCLIEINECESQPCLHGGTCFDRVNGFECLCSSGWQGPHCQLNTNECVGSPCVNAYTCKDLVGDYACVCQAGWTGKDCNINIQDCFGQCLNGGQCIDLVNGYSCLCLPGFEGHNCQHEIHECDRNPCLNGGKCVDHVASYTCFCTEGFSGSTCQVDTDPCSPNPCLNGASCYKTSDINNDYFCYCSDDFTGKTCEHRKTVITQNIDSCTLSIPNSQIVGGVQLVSSGICGHYGLCISRPGGQFDCSCSNGFTGDFCEKNINDCASNPCHNSGTCVDLINSYQCICADGWEGALCNINKNDCDPNPCRNQGNCIDLVSGYACQCPSGWKGKTCTLRDSQCDVFTCANGGTCVDLGDTFTCKCPSGWEGNTCHTPITRSCDMSPCKNNGTCVNSGDSFTCICRIGFEGRMCQENINECNPFPCYNGGKCVDGINRYTCECTAGFSGPDCRVNINECLSSPCTFGSTCIDGIGEYRCICPVGRSGTHCERVKGQETSAQSCMFNRRSFRSGVTWKNDCKLYTCDDGDISFIELPCGPENCATVPNITSQLVPCPGDEVCIVQKDSTCFTPPCLPWGRCQPRNLLPVAAPHGQFCYQLDQGLARNCAKVTMIFDKANVPIGVTVEEICIAIQRLVFPTETEINSSYVALTCSLSANNPSAVKLLLSIDETSVERFQAKLKKVVYRITGAINSRQVSSAALTAVTEVIVETSLHDEDEDEKYLVPVICSLIVILGCVAIILLVIWHKRQTQENIRRLSKSTDFTEERTNNADVDNLKNLRRYKNPLYEKDKIAGNRNVKPKHYREFDHYKQFEPEMDEHERSDTRLLRQDDFIPGSNDWPEHVQARTRVKDTNIELQKSRYQPNATAFSGLIHGHEFDDTEVIV